MFHEVTKIINRFEFVPPETSSKELIPVLFP